MTERLINLKKNILKSRMARGSMLFVFALTINSFFNIAFNIYLGRILDIKDFGIVTLVISLLSFANIIFIGLSATVSHTVAFLQSSKKEKAIFNFYEVTKRNGLIVSLAFSIIWILFSEQISRFFNIDSCLPILLFVPVFSLGTILSTNRGYLQGQFSFFKAGSLSVIEALGKFLAAIIFVFLGLNSWTYLPVPISVMIAFLFSVALTRKEINAIKSTDNFKLPFPSEFFFSSVISRLATIIFLGLDFILIKHFLNPEEAGYYALLSLVGKMIFFMGEISSIFTIPLVGRDVGGGKNPRKTFSVIFAFTSLFTILGVVILGFFGKYTVPFIFGRQTYEIVRFLPVYTIALAGFTIANAISTYHLAKKEYIFPVTSIINSAITVAGMIIYHDSLDQIVQVLFITSIINIFSISVLHFLKVKDEKTYE